MKQHSELIHAVFGQTPKVFRNTELIYDDRIAGLVAGLGFRGMFAEGIDNILAGRSPNHIYRAPGTDLKLLLKDYRHSDDIAFRFSNTTWEHYPLTPDKFAHWMHRMSSESDVVNLFMDYETFGEHQWEITGIFDFMNQLPGHVLSHSDWDFVLPSEAIDRYSPLGDLSYYRTTSWADSNRDLSAWQGNRMQKKALDHLYGLIPQVSAANDPYITDIWKKLQTSDHFYYMSTKPLDDGAVHAYFSPFESPYDAFINYMNVLRDFSKHVADAAARPRPEEDSRMVIEKIRFSVANGIAPEDLPTVDQLEELALSLQ